MTQKKGFCVPSNVGGMGLLNFYFVGQSLESLLITGLELFRNCTNGYPKQLDSFHLIRLSLSYFAKKSRQKLLDVSQSMPPGTSSCNMWFWRILNQAMEYISMLSFFFYPYKIQCRLCFFVFPEHSVYSEYVLFKFSQLNLSD